MLIDKPLLVMVSTDLARSIFKEGNWTDFVCKRLWKEEAKALSIKALLLGARSY